MGKILVLLLMFVCNLCVAQTEVLSKSFLKQSASVIKNRPLAASDFEGSPDLKSSEIAETRSAIDVEIIKFVASSKTVKVTFEVLPYFIRSSWIRNDARTNPDTSYLKYVLRHEQDHYDLVTLAALEIERALNKQSEFDKRTVGSEINAIYAPNYKIYSDLNKYYETDVEHGANSEKQVLWNHLISSAMKDKSWEVLLKYMKDHSTIKVIKL